MNSGTKSKGEITEGHMHDVNENDVKPKKSGSLPHYSVFLVGVVTFSQLFAIAMLTFIASQYGYARFSRILFPNETVVKSGESRCFLNTSGKSFNMEETIQKATARWSVYIGLSLGPILFAAPILSSLSDKYGRKHLMMVPLVGSLLKCGLFALTIRFKWNIYLVPVWNALESCSGSWVLSIALACSYAADVTSSGKDRSIAIAVVELFIGLGFLLASFASGYLIKAIGFFYPLVLSLGITGVCGVVLFFFVPESLPKERRKTEINILKQIKLSFDFYFKKNVKGCTGTRWRYIVCIAAFSCVSLGSLGRTNIEILYQLGSPFCWTSVDISIWGTYRTLAQQVVGIILIKILQRCMTDEMIALMGMTSAVAYFVTEGLASNTAEMYIVPLVGCMGIVEMAMLRSIMSKMTSTDKQGSLFAGIALFETLFVMTGATASGAIYSSTVAFYRGSAFFIMAAINACGFILILVLYTKGRRISRNTIEITIPPPEEDTKI